MIDASKARMAWSRPGRPIRRGMAVLLLFIATLVGWSLFVPLSDASVARGSLQVEGRSQSVQHPYGGVVQSLDVADGDTVARGDVLLTLSDTEARAARDVLLTDRETARARLARLKAERDGLETPEWFDPDPAVPEAAAEARANQSAVLDSRRRQHRSAIAVIERRIDQLGERIAGAASEASGLEAQAALAEQERADAQTLLDKGLARRPRVLELERQVSGLQAQLGAKRSEIAAARQSIAEAKAEIAQLEQDRQAGLSEQIEAVQSTLAGLTPRIETARDRLERMLVRAPASGSVVGLSIFTEGGVVEPGATLMEIVPSDTPFYVDARLPLTDLHDISAGQSADLQLLALPRSARPDLTGTVETVSADALTDDRSGQSYYALKIRLDATEMADAGVDLQSGMPVQVIMETAPRTLIAYLTSPLLDQIDTAFHED